MRTHATPRSHVGPTRRTEIAADAGAATKVAEATPVLAAPATMARAERFGARLADMGLGAGAGAVQRMTMPTPDEDEAASKSVQKQPAPIAEDEDEEASKAAAQVQTKPAAEVAGGGAQVQRTALFAVQREEGAGVDPGAGEIHRLAREGTRTPSSALPHADRIQRAFGGHDVRGVAAHVGGAAGQSAARMNAAAYTSGEHVVFSGNPSLHTAAHEAAHVIQQRAGVNVSEGVGRVGDSYEKHADAVAARVVAGQSAVDLLDGMAGPAQGARQSVPDAGGRR